MKGFDMSAVPHLPGKFIWFEHVSNDIAKARAFYEPLFGWHVETMAMGDAPYHLIMNGSGPIGGLRADASQPTHWLSHLSVPDVDTSHRAAVAAGAKSLGPPTDFAPVGRGALIADPTGAVLSLWKSQQGDRPDTKVTPFGDWYWNELWTSDAERALRFYEETFGFTHDEMDMDGQGSYLILKTGDQPRGGIFQPESDNPPMWLPYVHVDDVDGALAKLDPLGGKVFMPAADVPGVGRMAGFFDSQGAAIAIIRGATPA
jgi:uncharacterized protein